MDFPEGARVLNVSIDLGVHGRDAAPRPPVEAYLRVIDEPVLRLVSVDLGATADITSLAEVFDFAKDYLGLLKAAVIAAGIVPPGIEGSGQSLADLLARMVGPGRGLELVSNVNDIPKGSRLAVSTNLLAALIARLHARHRPGRVARPASCRRTSAGWSLARAHPGRMAGRLRRRLAGFRRRLAGHEADRRACWPARAIPSSASAAAACCRSHRILDADEVSPETRQQAAGQPGAGARRHGAERRPDPGDGHREVPAALARPNGRARQEAMRHPRRDRGRAARRAMCARIGAATTRNFRRPDPDHHPVGQQPTTPRR